MNLTELYRQKQKERLEQMIKDRYLDADQLAEAFRKLGNAMMDALEPIMNAVTRAVDVIVDVFKRVFGPIKKSILKVLKSDSMRSYTEPSLDKRQQLHRYKFNRV